MGESLETLVSRLSDFFHQRKKQDRIWEARLSDSVLTLSGLFSQKKEQDRRWEADVEEVFEKTFSQPDTHNETIVNKFPNSFSPPNQRNGTIIDKFPNPFDGMPTIKIMSPEEKIELLDDEPLDVNGINIANNFKDLLPKLEPFPDERGLPEFEEGFPDDLFEVRDYGNQDDQQEILPLFNEEKNILLMKNEQEQAQHISKSFVEKMLMKNEQEQAQHISKSFVEKMLKDEEEQAQHIKKSFVEKIEQEEEYNCTQCSHVSETKIEHLLHVKKYHAKEYRCPDPACDFSSTRQRKLEIHERKSHGKKFNCPNCDKTFDFKKSCKRHNERHHLGRSVDEKTGELVPLKNDYNPHDRLICPRCNANVHKKNMRRHIEHNHEGITWPKGPKKYTCQRCNFASHQPGPLRQHIRAVHDKIKDAKCPQCPYATITDRKLQIHVRFYHDKIYDFTCDQCQHATPTIHLLKAHVARVHQKIKPHHCDACPAAFSTKSHLKKHIAVVHEKSYRFNCEKCVYKNNDRGRLRDHLKTVHNIEEPEDTNEYQEWKKENFKTYQFNCDMCGYKNNSRRYFLLHMKKDHKLDVHPQGTFNDSDVEEHIRKAKSGKVVNHPELYPELYRNGKINNETEYENVEEIS